MKRREFVAGLGGAVAAWPFEAGGQQAAQVRRLAILTNLPGTDTEGSSRLQALRNRLKELGWTDGLNIRYEMRVFSGDYSRARELGTEIIASKPDVIFAATASALAAVQSSPHSIPTVFAQVADPVGSGFVESLARPGRNTTGFASTEFSMGAKWIDLLKDLAPTVEHVGVFYDPSNPSSSGYIPLLEAAARRHQMRTFPSPVRSAEEIESAIVALSKVPHNGAIVISGPQIALRRELIASLFSRYRVASVFPFRAFTASGGLASYGIDNEDVYRRAGSYVDRILRGQIAGDLPVQLPTRFELIINLKTARVLGITIPTTVLARADEVIE